MRVDDFDYELPESLIASRPLEQRSASRLLVLDRETGKTQHRAFADLPQLLPDDSLLVLNDTKVIAARLLGTREHTGGRAEVFLVRHLEQPMDPVLSGRWECLIRTSKKVGVDQRIMFAEGACALITQTLGKGLYEVELTGTPAGLVPLPPYLGREPEDADTERYQTVYARRPGAVAAPTAGLHFTPELLDELSHVFVTLHVGIGTFLPVRGDTVEAHEMHTEPYEIPADAQTRIESAGTVVAVGTTSARALEAGPGQNETDLFIYPGYDFKTVDALVTNFHLPRSSLLMLVSAFAGRDPILHAYEEAIREKYRFYSYGDAMLIL